MLHAGRRMPHTEPTRAARRVPLALLGGALALLLTAVVTGCAATESETVGATASVTATSEPTPMPIEEVVALDPLAEPLVQAGHALVAGSEGFAPVEARTQLDMATQTLEADVQVVQLSMAGGTPASQATPPVDEARLAADLAAVYAAIAEVRTGVVDAASRVLNDETPDADQSVRDDLYLAVVAQQTAAASTANDDTPRQLLELVAKVRAAQDAQVAGAAAREAAAQGATGGGDGGDGSGSSSTFIELPYCYQFPPITLTDPVTGETHQEQAPPYGPGC